MNGKPQKSCFLSQKGVDIYTRLLYNPATPRYKKVFFPKLLCAAKHIRGGRFTGLCRVNLNRL
ncbi:MAG TPA: hypothetical protein DCY50_00755 [Franconibacter helveticus]|nr:hypothetical protein [Franconibacter helveticus]